MAKKTTAGGSRKTAEASGAAKTAGKAGTGRKSEKEKRGAKTASGAGTKGAATKESAKGAAKAPAKGDVVASTATTAESMGVLLKVRKKLKAPSPGALELVLRGTSESELVRDGAQVGTEKVVADGARVYAQAASFYVGASAARRKLVRGASEELVALAVDHLVTLEERRAAHEARSEKGGRERAAALVKERVTLSEAIVVRDQGWRALANFAGDDKELRAKVDAALGTAATPEALVRGLRGLAVVTDEALGSEEQRQRGALFGVDDELAGELRATADAVQNASGAPERKSERATEAQSALDREDGVQLRMFRAIVSAFEAAHDRDASVPRLAPIALRRLFVRKRGKAGEGEGKEDGSGKEGGGGKEGEGKVSGGAGEKGEKK